jgi:DNA polymerase (family 10)
MFPDTFARQIAQDLVDDLSGYCERIEIAGSLRRRKRVVNDIDIVVIPKFVETSDDTLFGEPVRDNLLDRKLAQLCLLGELIIEANGPRIKRFVRIVDGDTTPIDIYIAHEQSWSTTLLIRTGSRVHNIKLAKKAMVLHMRLLGDGSGLLTAGGTIIPVQSEEEIFQLLGLSYRSPEERE